jgi:hypothetical protein
MRKQSELGKKAVIGHSPWYQQLIQRSNLLLKGNTNTEEIIVTMNIAPENMF